jgi:large subunit ribosomal protein L29
VRTSEIRDMTDVQIDDAIDDAREEMLNLRIQRALGKLDDFTRFKELKRDLARMLTIRRERHLAAELVEAGAPAEDE